VALLVTVAWGADPAAERPGQTTATTANPTVDGATPAGAAAHIDPATRNHSTAVEAVLIAKHGSSKLPILISEKVSPATQRLANELASCLQRITGAKFEVKTGVQGPGIFVGTIEQFPTPSAAEGLRIYEVYDGRDAYAILTGESLRFSMKNGTMYPDNPPGTYMLTDMTGRQIARGEVPICAKVATPIELKVPAAGVYYFKFNDYGAGTAFLPAKDQRAAFVPEGPRGYTLLRTVWFYVPKGTNEVQLGANGGGVRMAICDPSGRWIESKSHPYVSAPEKNVPFLKADGFYYVIPVPQGMDGAMWKLMLPQCSFHLRFFNIPTILSLTSDGPIMPEELAKKDGLN
jgi:hypothetical protein